MKSENKKLLNEQNFIDFINKTRVFKTRDIVLKFGVSRQYVNRFISKLLIEDHLLKIGRGNNVSYVLNDIRNTELGIENNIFKKDFKNKDLEEHKILDLIEKDFLLNIKIQENIKSIFDYSFTEMLNNAIDHSNSTHIKIETLIVNDYLEFKVEDFGIGVFKNIKNKKKLNSELEAVQELLKGKTTTAPSMHSGEGIFFTSKVADVFELNSFGNVLIVDNEIEDVFFKKTNILKKGTTVLFRINLKSNRHLNDIFKKYTDLDSGNFGFNKTEVLIKLYNIGGIHISRSQARRVLSGLDKFDHIVLDYENVPTIGQAFADEVYRVFQNKYINIKIEDINKCEAVDFMIQRAKHNKN